MYESLVAWCKFPVLIYPHTGHSVSGDEIESAAVTAYGYRVDEMRKITDKDGKEYVSNAHVYFPPEVTITVDDMLSLVPDSKPREIRKLGGYSDGETGKLDLIVAYL